jgi:hypothetical protein
MDNSCDRRLGDIRSVSAASLHTYLHVRLGADTTAPLTERQRYPSGTLRREVLMRAQRKDRLVARHTPRVFANILPMSGRRRAWDTGTCPYVRDR